VHGQQVGTDCPDRGHNRVQIDLVVRSRRAPAMFQVATRRLGIAAAWQSAHSPACV
jgi:hypothetical protein